MYSDRNFEIRPEYRERPPRLPRTQRFRPPEDSDDLGDLLIRALFGSFIIVVILFAVLMGAATWGWVQTLMLTSQPQQLTERGQYEHIQEERGSGSSARPGGGTGNSDPSAGRSTQTGAQTAPQDEVVLEEGGSNPPVSYADTEQMADRERNSERELPPSSPDLVRLWGQNWFPGSIAVKWNQNLPDGSRGHLAWVPAGGTASVYRSSSRGTPLV